MISRQSGAVVPLEITTGDRFELNGLYDWLSHDPRIAKTAKVTLASSDASPWEQGALDVIQVILDNATAIAGLAISFAAWREARRPTCKVTFRVDGRAATISGEDPDEIEEMLRKLHPESDIERRDDTE